MRMQWIPGLPSPPPLEGLGTRLLRDLLTEEYFDPGNSEQRDRIPMNVY